VLAGPAPTGAVGRSQASAASESASAKAHALARDLEATGEGALAVKLGKAREPYPSGAGGTNER
jgi:hypothetical protein